MESCAVLQREFGDSLWSDVSVSESGVPRGASATGRAEVRRELPPRELQDTMKLCASTP
jgi:hypothetical protein